MRGRLPESEGESRPSRAAAAVVVGFLSLFLVPNTYWGSGTRGLEWILGSDVSPPLALVWAQEVAIVVGIVITLGRTCSTTTPTRLGSSSRRSPS